MSRLWQTHHLRSCGPAELNMHVVVLNNNNSMALIINCWPTGQILPARPIQSSHDWIPTSTSNNNIRQKFDFFFQFLWVSGPLGVSPEISWPSDKYMTPGGLLYGVYTDVYWIGWLQWSDSACVHYVAIFFVCVEKKKSSLFKFNFSVLIINHSLH